MPCLSRNADSDLSESISVSNAESQLALPFTMTTVFGASVICSPKGSAVWTGAAAGGVAGGSAGAGGGGGGAGGVGAGGVAGVSAAAGGVVGAADGLAAGAGVAVGAGAGVADVAGGGDCARALPRPSESVAIGISATMARRKELT